MNSKEYNEVLSRLEKLEKDFKSFKKNYAGNGVDEDFSTNIASSNTKVSRPKFVYGDRKYIQMRTFVKLVLLDVIADNNIRTFEEFCEYYDPTIHKRIGMIRKLDEIKEKYKKSAENHFFMKEEDIIHFDDGDYVICKEWDAKNVRKFFYASKEHVKKDIRYCSGN